MDSYKSLIVIGIFNICMYYFLIYYTYILILVKNLYIRLWFCININILIIIFGGQVMNTLLCVRSDIQENTQYIIRSSDKKFVIIKVTF